MKRRITRSYRNWFTPVLFLAISGLMYGQVYRNIDGSNNNLNHPEWGAVGTNQLHFGTIGFEDGISQPAGQDRPNPRHISNLIFDQEGLLPDAMGLSDYAWVWGQFIDHDITLVVDHPSESMDITVPAGDPFFDPQGTGQVVIGMHRSNYDFSTGNSPSNPRAFPNGITAFIDASNVYGSDAHRAAWLRTFENGKLKTSSGQLLPYNTLNGEFWDEIDPNAPEMAMPMPFVKKWFVAGDVRANENPLLLSVHTLFVREHNRLCDLIRFENATWTDEDIYQRARKIVGAMIQAIVYEEWLPTMGVHMAPYQGYDKTVNPGMMNVFTAAAYRYGHTVINSEILRMDNNGHTIQEGNILLRDAFFNPSVVYQGGGLEPLFKGMSTHVEQEFDCKMIDDLRNFLFGPPGAGGLDLASLNINRGRDRGLPDYNTVRTDFGLEPITRFMDLTQNPWLNSLLETVYGDINNIDPWVGVLAEDHMANTLFGETVMEIMIRQFQALRDGDRFFYKNDPDFTWIEIEEIRRTTLAEVIRRNTATAGLQDNVFLAQPHTSTHADDLTAHPFALNLYPNPSTGHFSISAEVSSVESGLVVITDHLGRIVDQRPVDLTVGKNIMEWNIPDGMPSGLYHIELIIKNRVDHKMLVLTRP